MKIPDEDLTLRDAERKDYDYKFGKGGIGGTKELPRGQGVYYIW